MAKVVEVNSLWCITSEEHSRDEYWLKPIVWEGPGEYQRIKLDDCREGFAKIHDSFRRDNNFKKGDDYDL